ncbi:MAG: formamidopyrimidine-DNA glycosylase [Kiritimatiellia bacterium]
MPELPEVETWRRLAEQHVLGLTVQSVFAAQDEIIFDQTTAGTFKRALEGRVVTALKRKGKHLWMELDQRPWPYFHFGMSGSFEVYRDPADRPTYCKAELTMEDGVRLAYRNVRRIGKVRLWEDPTLVPPVSKLGFDPFLNMPTLAEFQAQLTRRKAPVKAVLLDQGFAAGVGNWIADEILFQAGVHPEKRCNLLSDQEVKIIRSKMASIIKKAVDVSADAERFPKTWLFHHRWGKNPAAETVHGHRVAFITVGGRTTAFVPDLQG